jgi:hypothetical protein
MFGTLAGNGPTEAADDPAPRVVIPFDFESKFDGGDYGRRIGDQLWTKLKKQGGMILPESMQDVRDYLERRRLLPGPDTPLATLKTMVVDDQAGTIAIWGKVERAPGHALDVYDLRIKVADFTTDPPTIIADIAARTETVSEIPHVHVAAALEKLASYLGTAPPRPSPGALAVPAPAGAADGPNLVRGDFDRGKDHPEGWDPLPAGVTWLSDESKPGNRYIRFTQDEGVAGSTGVLYYSDYFPVDAGATYRFHCRFRTSGSAVKVFIKAYDEFPTKARDKGGKPLGTERREVYRSQQNLQGPVNAWTNQTQDFTPKHTRFTPRWGRVMLYAYWPAGTVDWDSVEVVKVKAAATPERPATKRAQAK